MTYTSNGPKTNIRKTDVILKLKPMEGERPKNTSGMVDARLFTGSNDLHAIMDPQSSLWRLKYDSGIVPSPLKQQFTSFSKMLNFVEDYFKRRHIMISEVLD